MERGTTFSRLMQFFAVVLLLGVAAAPQAQACACGCGVFDIGNVFPSQPGGTAYFEYDFMNQNKNRSGTAAAAADTNDDKDIRTHFLTLGGQYLWASGFGVMLEVPTWQRHFETTDGGARVVSSHAALGDIRLSGVYSGFFEDRSTGVTLGIKFASGDFTHPGFDRDTEIGSGSTDIMVGGFHRGALDGLEMWRYFAQARYETAAAAQGGYRPGDEIDTAAGVSYDAGDVVGIDVAPMVQLLGSWRRHDSGVEADADNSGYSRLVLAPGIDFGFDNFVWHAEVGFPVYQNVIGHQLVAPALFKTSLAMVF